MVTPAKKNYKSSTATEVLANGNMTASSKASHYGSWAHIPTNLTLAWLVISIPLVLWDAGYVLLRPWSMTGGFLHWPLWVPYEIYMRTDLMYGWKAFEEKNGFTSAQASMNLPETLMYCCYLYLVFVYGTRAVSWGKEGVMWGKYGYVGGQAGAAALLLGFAAAVMTFSKTILYGLNEVFSEYSNTKHNDWENLIKYYILPNGAWLVASGIMCFNFGSDILRGLSLSGGASEAEETKQD